MRPLAVLLIALLIAAPMIPAQAQAVPDAPAPGGAECFPFAPGCDRLPRLFDDLTRDLAPLLDDLATRLDPWMRQLTDMLGDLSGWEAPEVLPNGDILIRRRPPSPNRPDQSGDAPAAEPFEL
jgi:hypothetical protein